MQVVATAPSRLHWNVTPAAGLAAKLTDADVAIVGLAGEAVITTACCTTHDAALAEADPVTLPTVTEKLCVPDARPASENGLVHGAATNASRMQVCVETTPPVVQAIVLAVCDVIVTVGAGGSCSQLADAVTGTEPAPPVAVTVKACPLTVKPV